MTDDGGLSRRRFGALAVATASAGCLGGDDEPEPTARLDGGSEYIIDVELRRDPSFPLFLPVSVLRVRLEQPENGDPVTALALISPDGRQTDAGSLLTGETSIEFSDGIDEGTYEIVVLNGGDVECEYGCRHSGGTVLERVPVVISGVE